MQNGIFKPGDVCGAYRILSFIGSGGVAEVYKSTRLDTQEVIALKVLRPCYASNPYVTEHMLAEAELLSKLNHDNVVLVKDVGNDRGVWWIAMEFLPGATLRALLKSGGALPIATALYYAREIADGVSAVHEMQVIHRDLKPENVMITDQNKVKVLDMGAAKFCTWDVRKTQTGTVFGTPLYMSPEHIREEPLDARSDIYSLGLILYEMLAGHHPLAKPNGGTLGKYEICERQLNADPPPVESIRKEIPSGLSDFVHRSLAKNRALRPSTMTEFAKGIRVNLRSVIDGAQRLESLPIIAVEYEVASSAVYRGEEERRGGVVVSRAAESARVAAGASRSGLVEVGSAEASLISGVNASLGENGSAEELYSGERRVDRGDYAGIDPRSVDDDDEGDDDSPTLVLVKRTEGTSPLQVRLGADGHEPPSDEALSEAPEAGPNGTQLMDSARARETGTSGPRRSLRPLSSRGQSVPRCSAPVAEATRVNAGSVEAPAGKHGRDPPAVGVNGWRLSVSSFPAGTLQRDRLIEHALWALLGVVMIVVMLSFVFKHI